MSLASSDILPAGAEAGGFDADYGTDSAALAELADASLSARLTLLDLFLVCVAWISTFVASILFLGWWPFVVYSVATILLTLRGAILGFIILMMIHFTPTLALTYWPLMKIMFVVVFVRALLDKNLRLMARQTLQRPAYLAAFLTALTLISIVYAPSKDWAVSYAVWYVKALAFFVMVLAFTYRLDIGVVLLKSLAVLGGVALLLGVIHNLYRDSVAYTTLYHLYFRLGLTEVVVDPTSRLAVGRWLATGVEPNYWAAGLMFPFGVSIGLVGASRSIRSRALWLVVCGAILVGIFGSLSRAAILCIPIVAFVLVMRMRGRSLLPSFFLILVAAVLILSWGRLEERILGIGENIRELGGSGRLDLWAASFEYWTSSPLWGHGMGSTLVSIGAVSHNTYVTLLAEVGLAGIVVYLWILLAAAVSVSGAAKLANRTGNRRMRWMFEGCFAGLVGMMMNIGAITAQNPMFVWMAAALCIGTGQQFQRLAYHAEEELELQHVPEY